MMTPVTPEDEEAAAAIKRLGRCPHPPEFVEYPSEKDEIRCGLCKDIAFSLGNNADGNPVWIWTGDVTEDVR